MNRVPGVTRALAVVAAALAVAVAVALAPGHRGWFDVGVYYGTVHYWLDDGGQVYDYLRPGTVYGFTYPPFALLTMAPMELVSWHTAVALSVVLNAAASALLLYGLVDPLARRRGWPRWYALGLSAVLFAALEPVRDTVSFGQVNLLLLALVYADLRLLSRGSRLAGLGIGLATAVKLTPALFIGYLLVARSGAGPWAEAARYRAAATAAGTTAGATLLAALVMPGASRVFWTEALWDTGRVGSLGYVSNQSLRGLVARLYPTGGGLLWALGAALVVVVWVYRVRHAGDDVTGFALTGVVACLVSPVTWVHHLVWLVPALVLLAEAGRGRLAGAAVIYVLLVTGPVWLWSPYPHGVDGFLGGNAYVWVCLALLFAVPVPAADPARRDAGRLVRSIPGPSGWRTPAN